MKSTMILNGKKTPVFKASLHNHSTSSDGLFTPQEIAGFYKDAGYDVFAISDHNAPNDISKINVPDLTVISGIEMHPLGPRGVLWHILALGTPKDMATTYKTGKEAIAMARAQGAVVIVAHPRQCGFRVDEVLELEDFDGIEIYNNGCRLADRAASEEFWDSLLESGKNPCRAIAVDDCHDWTSFSGGWTMVCAPDNSVKSIMDAIRKGDFYATTGPEFKRLELTNGHFIAEFTEVETAVLIGNKELGYCERSPRAPYPSLEPAPATSLNVDVSSWPKGSYLRCRITDKNGHSAWSQPYVL